jgi:LysR family transcriptional regulator for metE and metH
MDLEVRHLKLVRAVTSAGSLSGAGSVLNLTQSALSHQLRDIEARLGTPLFLRVGKRMMLTPAGERLLRSADEVLETIERTEAAIRQMSGGDRGLLRLTTECYTCYHWLPALLKRYRRTHPRVEVRIDPDATLDPFAHLLDGRLDVAIVSDPVRDRRIVARAMFADEMVVIVDPKHPLAGKRLVGAEDLAAETLAMYSRKEESTIYKLLADAGVIPANVQVIKLTEAIIEIVKAGLGVAFLARWAVESTSRRERSARCRTRAGAISGHGAPPRSRTWRASPTSANSSTSWRTIRRSARLALDRNRFAHGAERLPSAVVSHLVGVDIESTGIG